MRLVLTPLQPRLVLRFTGLPVTSSLTMFPFLFKLRSWTLCAQWMYHMTPAHLLVCFLPRVTCYQLVYLYVPFPISRVSLCYRFGLTTRLCLSVHFTPSCSGLSTRLLTHYFWTLTRSSSYDCLYLYLIVHYIYGWGWGFVPHLQSTLQPP